MQRTDDGQSASIYQSREEGIKALKVGMSYCMIYKFGYGTVRDHSVFVEFTPQFFTLREKQLLENHLEKTGVLEEGNVLFYFTYRGSENNQTLCGDLIVFDETNLEEMAPKNCLKH